MRRTTGAAALVAVALFATACQSVNQEAVEASGLACPPGSDCFDEVKPVGPGSAFTVQAGDLYFEKDGVRSEQGNPNALTIDAVEGDVEVTLDNVGAALHNFTIDESIGNKAVEAPAGSQETGALGLFAGEYVFYCSIPGHRAAGMVGTLIVHTEADAPATEDEGGAGEGTESPSPSESPSPEASPSEAGSTA